MAFASPVERELAQLLMFKDSDKKQATAKTMIANIRKMNISKADAQRVLKTKLLKRVAMSLQVFKTDQQLGKNLLAIVKQIKAAAAGTPMQSPMQSTTPSPSRRPSINIVGANSMAGKMKKDPSLLPRRSPRVSVQIATSVSQAENMGPPARKMNLGSAVGRPKPKNTADRAAALKKAKDKLRQKYAAEENKKRNRTVSMIDMVAPVQKRRGKAIKSQQKSRGGRNGVSKKPAAFAQESITADFF